MKRKIGILGGTFDPPHMGHLIIANEVLNQLELDEVRLMPNREPPHKEKRSGTTAQDRLAMLRLAIEDHPLFSVDTIELHREGPSYTYHTMKAIREQETNAEYYFIIGADMVEFLPRWYNIDKLLELVQFVGTNRPDYTLETPYPILNVKVPMIEISSSMIRNRVRNGDSIRYLTPERVIRYIEEHHLYET
ncbi:nicotinate-nucleotide adenylyltransferase [Siminovitchia sediminis]|uniref:Probable nicotinate-nucleotide adenylyltransferase n=1 Tax=Siminovitchia sediminis TaxID=1274353 RepID=A0ABW4KFE4_9BACI